MKVIIEIVVEMEVDTNKAGEPILNYDAFWFDLHEKSPDVTVFPAEDGGPLNVDWI